MRPWLRVFLVAAALCPACRKRVSAETVEAGSIDDRLFVPPGLSNTNVNGHDEGLVLAAFTLAQTAAGPELYAAVRNDGDAPACEAGMVTDFLDQHGERMTSAGSKLLSGRFYRLGDGTVIACIDPGQTAMTAATGLPEAVVIDEVGALTHRFPSFTLADIVPVVGLTLRDVHTVGAGTHTAYTGEIVNGLEQPAKAATVSIFPTSSVGRPLGVTTSTASDDIAAGASWSFVTGAVADPGVGYAAFPTATFSQ
jgi:hypothetical protein